jgi:hypothetical protein
MILYYTLLQSRTHALVLGHKFTLEGTPCELTYMPREIMKDHCNLGIRFTENQYPQAINIIRRSGLPGCKVYQEYMSPNGCIYQEIDF